MKWLIVLLLVAAVGLAVWYLLRRRSETPASVPTSARRLPAPGDVFSIDGREVRVLQQKEDGSYLCETGYVCGKDFIKTQENVTYSAEALQTAQRR